MMMSIEFVHSHVHHINLHLAVINVTISPLVEVEVDLVLSLALDMWGFGIHKGMAHHFVLLHGVSSARLNLGVCVVLYNFILLIDKNSWIPFDPPS